MSEDPWSSEQGEHRTTRKRHQTGEKPSWCKRTMVIEGPDQWRISHRLGPQLERPSLISLQFSGGRELGTHLMLGVCLFDAGDL